MICSMGEQVARHVEKYIRDQKSSTYARDIYVLNRLARPVSLS